MNPTKKKPTAAAVAIPAAAPRLERIPLPGGVVKRLNEIAVQIATAERDLANLKEVTTMILQTVVETAGTAPDDRYSLSPEGDALILEKE